MFLAFVLFASTAACAVNSDKRSTVATTVPRITGLAGEGRVLVELLRAGEGATFHAIYEVRRGDAVESTIEVWQRGSRTRVDSSTATGGTVAVFRTGERTDTCTREEGTWNCERGPAGSRGFKAFVDEAVNDLRGSTVVARDASIAGQKVRCFKLGEEADVCVTRTGIPARLAAGGSTTELTLLEADVTGNVFELPTA